MEFWQRLEHPASALVCGASRGIGLALSEQLLARTDVARVWAVARNASQSAGLAALAKQHGERLQRLDVDCCDEAALAALAQQLRAVTPRLHLLLCTVGVLQEGAAKAEKSLTQLDLQGLLATFQRNSFAPILLLKHLLPLLRGQHPCSVAALSARVGSIGDNRLGGWYAYRASKAALNSLTPQNSTPSAATASVKVMALVSIAVPRTYATAIGPRLRRPLCPFTQMASFP